MTGWTALVVVGVVVLAAVSFILPGRRHIALDVFVLFLGALGLAAAVRATHGASPDVHEPSLVDELADPLDVLPQRPAELERLEREVHLSLGSSFYLHHRLRPVLPRDRVEPPARCATASISTGGPTRRRSSLGATGLGVAAARPPRAPRPLGAGAAAHRAVRRRRRA